MPAGEVDDVVQDALVRAWTRRSTFDGRRGSVRVWLVAVLLDQARRTRTRARPTAAVPSAEPGYASDPTDRLGVEQAVAALPRGQREVVVLHYLADLSVDEVGAVLGITRGSVKSQLFAARKALRRSLEQI